MNKEKIVMDLSMSGLEGGIARVYIGIAPTITARLYKDPWRIVEIEEVQDE